MKTSHQALVAAALTTAFSLSGAAEVPVAEIQHAAHLGTFVGEVLSGLAVMLVALNIYLEIRHRHQAAKTFSYDHLDRLYQDLYSMAAQHPNVIDPSRTWNLNAMPSDERLRYEAYVWKVWVVCETVFDQTKNHEDVWNTWRSAIDIEARLHVTWILRELTYRPDSFKEPFRQWLRAEYGHPAKLDRLRGRAMARYAQIRLAKADDMESILALEQAGFSPGILESRQTFEDRLKINPHGFFVLTLGDDTKPVGYLCTEIWTKAPAVGNRSRLQIDHSIADVHDANGSCLYISSQTVLPALRGASLGEFMFRESLAKIRAGFPNLTVAHLLVNEQWHAARAIYDRCGFQVVEEIPGFFKPTDLPAQRAVVMTRSLPLDC